ncbi:cysteine--tRNA ligase [Candidatus Woesearchaeota archaeon]|nr:cysteine--tRNA ligase [Candidatus Woesearchaeota archaeon]
MLKLYNTLTNKKEAFKELKKGFVSMYTCGPTVYDFAHIGNFRAYICADILRRYLEYKGYKVKHVMNITDVDDKTIRDSQKQKTSLKKFTDKYTTSFFEDVEKLNLEKAHVYPRATETIKDIVGVINKLIKNKFAYKGEDGSIYYDISKFKDYGKLSNINIKKLKGSERVKHDEYEKTQVNDFALWKAWSKEDGDVFWETELGKGRPGWHIECSVMSTKNLGESFDIHTGGKDLIFPHHENEIAQSEGCFGKMFVKYWIHNEYLIVEGKKMSKSYGNFHTLRDILDKGYSPKATRYLLLSAHYKVPLNFTEEGLKAAETTIQKFKEFILKLKEVKGKKENNNVGKLISKVKKDFEAHMDDDLNISSALASIFDFMREINKLEIGKKNAKHVLDVMKGFDKVLGVLEFEEKKIPKEIKELAEKRLKARLDKDWDTSDKLRDKLKKKGYVIKDSSDGYRIKKE